MTIIEMTEPTDEPEKNSDPLDRASVTEMADRSDRIDRISRLNEQQQKPQADGTYAITECIECEDPIGAGRLAAAAGNLHCIRCANVQALRLRTRGY